MEKELVLVGCHLRNYLRRNGVFCISKRRDSSRNDSSVEEFSLQPTCLILSLHGDARYLVFYQGITSKNVRLIVGRYCRLYEMT